MKSILVLLLVCITLVQNCFAIDVSANSAILYEPVTKTVLFEKNSKERREIASTTKIMTAVVTLENANLAEVVTVPEKAVGTEGTSMYLRENEKLTVSDLLYGLLLQSGNDAAMTLAHHVGKGKISRFVAMMNKTAKRIGMKDTSFKNPSGLPDEGHLSTAYDMALLAAEAMQMSEFAQITATKTKTVAGRTLSNHNKLLRIYEGANGVKTGYTKAAGRCLVSSAKKDNLNLIAVTLSAPDDWQDHTKMLDYGFENFTLAEYSSENTEIPALSVVGGTDDSLQIAQAGKVSFLVKKDELDKIRREIHLPKFIYAPVTRGDVVGEIRYYLNGRVIGTSAVVSSDSLEEYSSPSVFEKILKWLGRK